MEGQTVSETSIRTSSLVNDEAGPVEEPLFSEFVEEAAPGDPSSLGSRGSVPQVVIKASLEVLRKSSEMLKTVLSDPKVAEEVFDVGDSQTLSEGNQIGDVDQDNSGKAYQQFLKTQLQAILDNCQLRLNLIEEVEEWLNMEAGFSAAGILTSAADILEDDEPEQCWQSFFAEGEKLKGKSMMLVELGQKLLQLLSELKIGVKELTAARQRVEPVEIPVNVWKLTAAQDLKDSAVQKDSIESINKIFDAMCLLCQDDAVCNVLVRGKELFNNMASVIQIRDSEISDADTAVTNLSQQCQGLSQQLQKTEQDLEMKQDERTCLKKEHTKLNQALPPVLKKQNRLQERVRRLNAAIDVEHARLIPVPIPPHERASQVLSANRIRRKTLHADAAALTAGEGRKVREDPFKTEKLKEEIESHKEVVQKLRQEAEKATKFIQELEKEKKALQVAAERRRLAALAAIVTTEDKSTSTVKTKVTKDLTKIQDIPPARIPVGQGKSVQIARTKKSKGEDDETTEISQDERTQTQDERSESVVLEVQAGQVKKSLASDYETDSDRESGDLSVAVGRTVHPKSLTQALGHRKTSPKNQSQPDVYGYKDSLGPYALRQRYLSQPIDQADFLRVELGNTQTAIHSVLHKLQQLRLNLSDILILSNLNQHALLMDQLESAIPAETVEEELPPDMLIGGIEETVSGLEEIMSGGLFVVQQRGMTEIERKTATSRLSDFEVWKQAIAKLQAKEIDFSGDLDRYQNVFLAYMKLWAEYEMPEEIYCRQPEKPKAKEGKRLTDHDVKPLEYIRKTLKGPEEPEVPAEEEPSLQVTAVHPVQVEVETEEEKELELPAEWKDDVMVAHEAFSKGLIPYDVYMRPLVLLAKLAVVLQHKVANLGNQYHELRLKQLYSEKIHSILKQISTDRMRVQKLFLEAGIRQYAAQFEELEDMELKIKLDQEYYDLLMQLTWAHNAIRDRLASLMEQSKMERIESEPELAEKETADLEVPPVSTVASQQRSVLEPEKKHAVEELEKKKKPEPEEKKEKSTKAKQQWANVSQNIKKKKLVEKFRDQHLAKEHESMEKGARRVSVKKAADEPRKLSKERKELREPRQPSKELETLEEPKRRPKAQTVSEELRKQSKEPRRSAEQLQSLKVRRGSGAVLSKESVTSAERKHQLKKHKGSEVQVQLDDDLEESDTGESTILSSYTSVGIRSSTPLQSQVTSAVDVEDDADIDSGAFLERLQRWVPSPSFSRHGPSVDLTDAVPEVSMRAFSSQFAVAELQPLYEQRAVGQETYMPDSEDLNLYTIGCPSTLFNKSLLKPRSSGGSSIGRTSFDIRTSRGDIVPGQESVETGHFLGMTTPSQAVQGYWQMSDIKNLSVRGWSLEMEASSVRPSIAEQQKPQKELFDMDTDSLHSKDDKEGLIHSPEPPPRTDLLPLRHRISLEPDDISDKTLDILRDDKTRGYKKVDKKRGDKKGAPVLPGVRVKTRPVDLKACGAAIGVPRPERQWVVYKSRWDVSPPGTDPRKSTHSACREVADVRKYSMAGGSVATDGSVKIHLSKKELAKLVSPKQALEATHEPRHQPLGKVAKMVSPRQALEATHKPLHQPLGKVHPLDMDRTFNALVFKNCLGNCLENLPKAAALTKSEIQDTRSRIKQQLQRHSRGSKILTETDTSFDQESTTYDMEEEAVEFLEPEHQVRNEAVTSVCKWVCENEVEMEKRRNNVCTPLPKISKETTVRAAFNRLLPLPGSMMKSKRKQQVKVGSRRTSSAPMHSIWAKEGKQTLSLMVPRMLCLDTNQSRLKAGRIIRMVQHKKISRIPTEPNCQHVWNKFLYQLKD